jgi:hypothetical protein
LKLRRGVTGVIRYYPTTYPILKKALFEFVIRLNNSAVSVISDIVKLAALRLFKTILDFALLLELT